VVPLTFTAVEMPGNAPSTVLLQGNVDGLGGPVDVAYMCALSEAH
jgi:hypothetical protein